MGSWGPQKDPTLYGILEFNVEKAIRYMESPESRSTFKYPQEKITINHFVGKVFGELLKRHPEINTELRFGRFYPRKNIDISFQVAIDGDHAPDLSSGLVEKIEQKDISEVAYDLSAAARKIRTQKDSSYRGIKTLSGMIPGFMQRIAVSILKWIISTLNLWSPALGIPKNAFGSMLITNVGSLGLDFALPALFPPANVPMIMAVGAIYKAPVYEAGADGVVTQIRLERHVRLCGAFDHRYVDGLHASRCARDMKKMFENPEREFQLSEEK